MQRRPMSAPDSQGLRSIIATLGAALVTLKQEGGEHLATKLLVNDAISTAHKMLGSQNAGDERRNPHNPSV